MALIAMSCFDRYWMTMYNICRIKHHLHLDPHFVWNAFKVGFKYSTTNIPGAMFSPWCLLSLIWFYMYSYILLKWYITHDIAQGTFKFCKEYILKCVIHNLEFKVRPPQLTKMHIWGLYFMYCYYFRWNVA